MKNTLLNVTFDNVDNAVLLNEYKIDFAALLDARVAKEETAQSLTAVNFAKLKKCVGFVKRDDVGQFLFDSDVKAQDVAKLAVYDFQRMVDLITVYLRKSAELTKPSDQTRHAINLFKTVTRCIAAERNFVTVTQAALSCTNEKLDALSEIEAQRSSRHVDFVTAKRQADITLKAFKALQIIGEYDDILQNFKINNESKVYAALKQIVHA